MIIFPAIGLHLGRCAHVHRGDSESESVLGKEPVAIAAEWVDQGAEWLHVVNLDGPLGATSHHLQALHRPDNIKIQYPGSSGPESGREELRRTLPVNLQQLMEIRQAVRVPIQFGGGLTTLDDIRLVLDLGADRIVLGMAAIENPSFLAEAIDLWGPERIVVDIGAHNGKVALNGRKESTGHTWVDVVDVAHQMQAMGVQRIVYSDTSQGGLPDGVNVEATARLSEVSDLRVLADGHVKDLEDIERLKAYEHYNIEGIITGHTIHTGALDLSAAIEIGHRPLEQFSAGIIPVRLIEDSAEFLLLYNWYYELWEFPRGPVEVRETTPESARRALHELTGQHILRFNESCNPRLSYVDVVRDYEIHHTVIYYLAEVEGNEVDIGHEDHCEAHWGDYRSTWELLTETAPELLPALDRAMACLQNRLAH